MLNSLVENPGFDLNSEFEDATVICVFKVEKFIANDPNVEKALLEMTLWLQISSNVFPSECLELL